MDRVQAMDKATDKTARPTVMDPSSAKRARRGHRAELLMLPHELLEMILWHCDHFTSGAIGATCRPIRLVVQALCWADDAWLVERVQLRRLLPLASASDHLCLRRLNLHPEEASATIEPISYGGLGRCLPIHLAFEERPQAAALQLALIIAHPAGVCEQCNAFSMLPIEYAAERGASKEVVLALIEAHHALNAPIAAPPYERPLTALHLAVINGASSSIVRALLRVGPEAAGLWGCENGFDEDFTDLLPLHLAAVYGPARGAETARVLEALAGATPCALATREGRHGMLPLHLAALSGAAVEALVTLARHFPRALHITDDHGRTPLDCARANARALAECPHHRVLPPGYSYREYVGLNPTTAARLRQREGAKHLAAGVACLETLESAQPVEAEHNISPPTTWRYSYAEGSYGTVLQEEEKWRGAAQ